MTVLGSGPGQKEWAVTQYLGVHVFFFPIGSLVAQADLELAVLSKDDFKHLVFLCPPPKCCGHRYMDSFPLASM